MRILVALIVGIVIGYVAFAPELASKRKEWLSKISEMIATSLDTSSSK
jgi:hypothetical protein